MSWDTDSVTIPRSAAMDAGTGDFTVAAWIKPRDAGAVVSAGGHGAPGWYLETEGRGALQFVSAGPGGALNGRIAAGDDRSP